MKLTAGIYDPYLDTLGGGERYCLTTAELLIKNGYQVDLFWSGDPDLLKKAQDRFNLDLSQVNIVPDIFSDQAQNINITQDSESVTRVSHHQHFSTRNRLLQFINKIKVTSKYDVIFYLSDWSIPFLFSKNNLLHVQVPFIKKVTLKTTILNLLKKIFLHYIICNSEFTNKFATSYFGNKCRVLYPPVDIEKFSHNQPKENIILSVGRFDNILNSKRQDLLIEAFRKLSKQNPSSGWQLYLVGGSLDTPEKNSYLNHLKDISQDLAVNFVINPSFDKLQDLYSRSKIFWHAAGYGVDESTHPENTEHFGMAPVEAMASGLVPLLVKKGGLPEIITDQVEGYLWESIDELVAKTQLLTASPSTLESMSQQSIKRSLAFSKENFHNNLVPLLKR